MCQVIFLCRPAVFLTDDVVNLEAEKRVIFVDQAILAYAAGAGDHKAAETGADVGRTQAISLLPSQVPSRPRFGEAHQVFQPHVVV